MLHPLRYEHADPRRSQHPTVCSFCLIPQTSLHGFVILALMPYDASYVTQAIGTYLGKPQKKIFFSGLATKALPLPLLSGRAPFLQLPLIFR